MPDQWKSKTWGDLGVLEYGRSLTGYRTATGATPVYGTNGQVGFTDEEPLGSGPAVIIGRKGAYRGVHLSRSAFSVIDTAYWLHHTDDIDPVWAYYKLLTYDINALDSGSAIPSLSRSDFYRLPVLLPPLPEQHRIAGILTDSDDHLTKLRELREKKHHALLAARDRLTRQRPGWKPIRLGEPTHSEFLATASLPRSALDDSSEVAYIHYGDIHTTTATTLECTSQTPRVASELVTRAARLKAGDIVFADASEDLDGVAKAVEVLPSSIMVVGGLHTIAVRFDPTVVAHGFGQYLQFFPEFRRHVERCATGTSVYGISKSALASAVIRIPPVEEQRQIATILSALERDLRASDRLIEKTEGVKAAMMDELLTGRTRLA